MDIKKFMKNENEKPLDNIVENGGFCGILRKIACIGDSLSSGEFESCENGILNYHDYYEYSWGQFMARDIGSTVYNFSKGGMCAEWYDEFAKEKGFFSNELACEAYIIALGVNDISMVLREELEFGGIEDINVNDYAKNGQSFVGYYGKVLAKYKEIQPKAKFFLVTMPRCEWNEDKRAELYDKHREILYKLAEMFDNCYVIDLREYAPVYDAEFKKTFYMGGHLNAAGYRLTALMMESYIDYIIRNNYEDFTQIGFIGKHYHNANYRW